MNRACRIPSQFTHSQFIIRVKSKRKNRCFIRTDQCYYYYHIFPIFFFVGPVCVFFSMFSCVCVFQMMQAACVHLCDPYSHPSTILLSFFSVYSEGFLLKFSIAAYLNLWRFFPLSNRSFLGGLKRGDTVKLPPVRSEGPHSSSHQNWENFMEKHIGGKMNCNTRATNG